MARDKQYYFIQEHVPEEIYHGSIGNMDVEQVFLANQFRPIRFPCHNSFSLWAKLVRALYLAMLFSRLPAGAIVFFQHPLYAGMNKMLLKLLHYRKSITVVCFIADINGLKYDDAAVLRKEVRQFRTYRYFIVHNEAMQEWLRVQVPHYRAAMINFFDFLAQPAHQQRTKSMTVAFAGNLEKSSFMEQMDRVARTCPSLLFNLYGPHATAAMQSMPNVAYKGVIPPYVLPQALEGSFGLIWDGEGVEAPAGSMGHYMQYITHHKTSLYILANMPLIVYEQAGSARLIEKHHIGFTIKSLLEIEEKLKTLPEDAYRQMCANTRALAAQIASGNCLTNALQEILSIIEQEQRA